MRAECEREESSVTILLGARQLIQNEENWCGGLAWRNCPLSGRCIVSACIDAAPSTAAGIAAAHLIAKEIGIVESLVMLGVWNDTHTHTEMLAALDKTIAAVTAHNHSALVNQN